MQGIIKEISKEYQGFSALRANSQLKWTEEMIACFGVTKPHPENNNVQRMSAAYLKTRFSSDYKKHLENLFDKVAFYMPGKTSYGYTLKEPFKKVLMSRACQMEPRINDFQDERTKERYAAYILQSPDLPKESDYESKDGGRYFIHGISLQNVPKVVRKMIMVGCAEVDVNSCFFAICRFIAQEKNVDVPTIESYLWDTKGIRNQIANDLNISIENVKHCLLALLGGARTQKNKGQELYRTLGEKLDSFLNHPIVSGIVADSKKLDLPKSAKERALHFQKFERKILDAMIEFGKMTGNFERLRIHDALVFSRKLSGIEIANLETFIKETTKIEVTVKQIEYMEESENAKEQKEEVKCVYGTERKNDVEEHCGFARYRGNAALIGWRIERTVCESGPMLARKDGGGNDRSNNMDNRRIAVSPL